MRTRRELLRQIKSQVAFRLGREPREVSAYRLTYDQELAGRFRPTDKSALLNQIAQSEIFYGGDFHALGQAQRTHLRILRSLDPSRPVTLALEAFPIQHQAALERLMSGRLQLKDLPAAVNWQDSWGFPWENYRPLLEWALARGVRLVALNSGRSLRLRDRAAAQVIKQELSNHPQALLYVIFGDLHLAADHLPAAVDRALRRKAVSTTLFINSARIYFQLARRGLEHSVDIVKLSRQRFCVMSAPPWVQWQSYLLFLDQHNDPDLDDEDEDFEAASDFDPTDQVLMVARLVARDLNLAKLKKRNLSPARLDFGDISIYGSDDERIWTYLEDHLNKREKALVRALISEGRSFLIPTGGVGYLAQPTINHAAYLAGQYLHSKMIPRRRPLWNFPHDLPALIWLEAVGFFASKLVNHKRVPETLRDLQARLPTAAPAQRDVLKLVLDQRLSQLVWVQEARRRPVRFRPRRRASYLEAARILGAMLGERLYVGFRSRKLGVSELLELMQVDVEESAPNGGFSRRGIEHILTVLHRRVGLNAFEKNKSKKERL